MSIVVDVDPVTFNITRVLTSAVMGGIDGFVVLLAGEKFKVSKGVMRLLVAIAALAAGFGSFWAGWASIRISLVIGIGMMIVGASLAFEKGSAKKGIGQVAGALALLVTGTSWLGWNSYLMFR